MIVLVNFLPGFHIDSASRVRSNLRSNDDFI
jgi:hypothetical protein